MPATHVPTPRAVTEKAKGRGSGRVPIAATSPLITTRQASLHRPGAPRGELVAVSPPQFIPERETMDMELRYATGVRRRSSQTEKQRTWS